MKLPSTSESLNAYNTFIRDTDISHFPPARYIQKKAKTKAMAVYQVTGSPQLWLDILVPVSNSTRVDFDTKRPCVLDPLVQIPTPVLTLLTISRVDCHNSVGFRHSGASTLS